MKAIDEWYKKWWNNRNPEEEPKPVPWEPDIDKSLPKDVYDAMVRTAHIDKEREIEADNERYRNALAERQNSFDGARAQTATELQLRQQAAMAAMSPSLDAARWSNQMLAQYQNTALGPQMVATYEGKSITPTWRNTEMNQGEITNHGVVRINFPFGQVEMDIRNEAELDRMVDMAKHMLRVHEENLATAAIRENLRMTSKQSEPMAQDTALLNTPIAPAMGYFKGIV